MQMLQTEKELISVIVPVYKVQSYLKRCLDSIMEQTYCNLEIILVDDGSPDKCGEICDEYALYDDRIKVIHKKNGGLSSARNIALDICSGEWISCIDSDDWVSPYYIENLYMAALEKKVDMSMSWYECIFKGRSVQSIPRKQLQNLEVLDAEVCLRRLLYQDGADTSAWGKLYRKHIIKDLRYPEGKLFEDIMVTVQAIHRSKRIAVISNVDYYYFQRETSILYESYSHRKMDVIVHMEELSKFVEKEYPQLMKAVNCRFFSATCNIVFQIKDKKYFEEDFINLWTQVKDKRQIVLKDKEARKKARIAAALSYLGYPFIKCVYQKTQYRSTRM